MLSVQVNPLPFLVHTVRPFSCFLIRLTLCLCFDVYRRFCWHTASPIWQMYKQPTPTHIHTHTHTHKHTHKHSHISHTRVTRAQISTCLSAFALTCTGGFADRGGWAWCCWWCHCAIRGCGRKLFAQVILRGLVCQLADVLPSGLWFYRLQSLLCLSCYLIHSSHGCSRKRSANVPFSGLFAYWWFVLNEMWLLVVLLPTGDLC